MKLLDRVLLTICALLLIFFSIILIIISLKIVNIEYFTEYTNFLYGKWEVGIIGAFIFILSFRFLLSGIKNTKDVNTMVAETVLGDIKISIKAIENTIKKTVKEFNGVRDVKIKINALEDYILVDLSLSVMPDINIPEMTQTIQKNVKEYTEKNTGISVNEVKVVIQDISRKSGRVS